jgi:hypothetical protein
MIGVDCFIVGEWTKVVEMRGRLSVLIINTCCSTNCLNGPSYAFLNNLLLVCFGDSCKFIFGGNRSAPLTEEY